MAVGRPRELGTLVSREANAKQASDRMDTHELIQRHRFGPETVNTVEGLVAAHDVANSASPSRAVPYRARRARSRRCEVYMSACRCRNVLVSCLCRIMEMCAGVCTVGA